MKGVQEALGNYNEGVMWGQRAEIHGNRQISTIDMPIGRMEVRDRAKRGALVPWCQVQVSANPNPKLNRGIACACPMAEVPLMRNSASNEKHKLQVLSPPMFGCGNEHVCGLHEHLIRI